MKKLFLFLSLILVASYGRAATQEVKEVARGYAVGPITVSTVTASTMSVAGFFALPGRYKITIENTDVNLQVAIGTAPIMSFASGYILSVSTGNFSIVTLPLNAGTTVWAIGQNNPIQSSVNTRVIEFK